MSNISAIFVLYGDLIQWKKWNENEKQTPTTIALNLCNEEWNKHLTNKENENKNLVLSF